MSTFGVIIGNRGFFPDVLARDGREEILRVLPPDLSVPLLIVQHMPPGFTAPFARRMNDICAVTVREASNGEPIMPGCAYVAPAGMHMIVRRLSNFESIIHLDSHPEHCEHIPSIDVLMKSVAEAFTNSAMGVILTGMGCDGAQGMKAIHCVGGITIGQNEESCAVYSMPRACADLGILSRVVPLSEIPHEILLALEFQIDQRPRQVRPFRNIVH